MKTIPVEYLKVFAQNPEFRLGIDWGSGEELYSTVESVGVYPYVQEFSNYESVSNVSGLGAVSSISIVLNDQFGVFKQYMGSVDLQTLTGNLYIGSTLLFYGKITDPLYKDKQFSFDLVEQESEEITGYTPDPVDLNDDELISRLNIEHWPTLYGTQKDIIPVRIFHRPVVETIGEVTAGPSYSLLVEDPYNSFPKEQDIYVNIVSNNINLIALGQFNVVDGVCHFNCAATDLTAIWYKNITIQEVIQNYDDPIPKNRNTKLRIGVDANSLGPMGETITEIPYLKNMKMKLTFTFFTQSANGEILADLIENNPYWNGSWSATEAATYASITSSQFLNLDVDEDNYITESDLKIIRSLDQLNDLINYLIRFFNDIDVLGTGYLATAAYNQTPLSSDILDILDSNGSNSIDMTDLVNDLAAINTIKEFFRYQTMTVYEVFLANCIDQDGDIITLNQQINPVGAFPYYISEIGITEDVETSLPEGTKLYLLDYEDKFIVDSHDGTTVSQVKIGDSVVDSSHYTVVSDDLWTGMHDGTYLKFKYDFILKLLDIGDVPITVNINNGTWDDGSVIYDLTGTIPSNSNARELNFILKNEESILAVLPEIAWQSMKAIRRRIDGSYELIDLTTPTASLVTFSANDVILGSITFGYTDINNLITVINGTFQSDSERPTPIIRKNNIALYGKRQLNKDMFTYNDLTSAKEVLDFWIARLSQQYYTVSFTTFLKYAGLEIWDRVSIDFDNLTFYNPDDGVPYENFHTGIAPDVWSGTGRILEVAPRIAEGLVDIIVILDLPTTGSPTGVV